MTWRVEKTDEGNDLVWDGVETGIAVSPTKGTANIQNANISTETGEIMASFARSAQTPQAITNGTLTPNGATDFTGPSNLSVGQWISVSASTVTSISTTTSPTTASVDYLVVAAGGGGGSAFSSGAGAGGGGGAGAMRTGSLTASITSYPVTVGTGGAGGKATEAGTAGTDSIFSTITSTGGGGGGTGESASSFDTGGNGGSGGGGGGESNGAVQGNGGTGTTGGNNGGNGVTTGAGGGGGGANAVGSNGSGTTGGAGGAGVASSITGASVTYAGGGGGGGNMAGLGGNGGGGNGSSYAGTPQAGTANTGGGGGGTSDNNSSATTGGVGGSGVVIISYVTGTCIATGGNITYTATNTIHTFTSSGTFRVLFIPKTNQYYVSYKSGTTYRLSAKFDPTGANALTHGTTGTVTFSTIAVPNSAIAKSTEKYTTSSSVKYRYYVLDANSFVWVYDTLVFETYGTKWMLPDPNDYSSFSLTGIGALNGMLLAVGKALIWGKPTTDLGRIFKVLDNVYLNEPFATNRKTALVGHQGKMYYCDGNYIGEVFPTTSLVTSIANIQSTCSYTASSTIGTISAIVAGSLPYSPDGTRIPAVFYTDVYGTQPTTLTLGTLYYIKYEPLLETFTVFSALTGGSAITLTTGAAGNQFFTTFWPFGAITGANGSSTTVQVSTQRVNLPNNETATCMVEVGNTVIIGGTGSTLYPWNQIDATPSDFIELPESNTKAMVNVNNMAYVFAGNKGNIYITNNSVASLVLKVPDYCAGVPGTPSTYIEPYFTWGDATYLRGRVYFSILDQTATKAGNCGGVWSFVPTQNFYVGQDIGMALRLENQNSYGDYDGVATILIPNEEQNAIAPQYWAWWQDSYSTGTSSFGVDYTNTTPVTQYIFETDLLPTGTLLSKDTFTQLEYKLTTPLTSTDSVQLYWRLNSTDAWTSAGTTELETDNPISGYYNQNFQKSQWVQFRGVITTPGTAASSFVRLSQLRLR